MPGFEDLVNAQNLIALLTLTAMEIVLGIDNIVFLSIVVSKLPQEKQNFARKFGLALALLSRLALLFSLAWIMGLTRELFSVWGESFSIRDLILIAGGLFLIGKAAHEIFHKVEGFSEAERVNKKYSSFWAVIFEVIALDLIFSLDSVITAVGMAQEIWIMVVAMLIAMAVMFFSARSVGNFVDRHPSVKILALSFLLLIGMILLLDGMGQHVPKGYVYFSMGFALLVELLNMRYRKKRLTQGSA